MISTDRLAVVFLDDDIHVLNAIERNIRTLRLRWHVQYFVDPYDAMDYLEQNGKDIDVLVCDNDMPCVKGFKILEAISSAFPDILRVTLSGILSAKTIVGCSKNAELIVCKPIPFTRLHDLIIAAYGKKHAAGNRPL